MHGQDVVAALAAGANFTWIGRAYLYGLMAGGKAGVDKTLEIFRTQITRTLKLLGVQSVADLTPDHVRFVARYADN
jgi:isopentenyl diphosphate isomerase/L-lactate dehydrogenase-like FMN-dependent dehydrogenase